MHPLISEALAERGYETLTPVQEAVSDPALVDEDLLVSAQTGSGKTVGFGLAIAPTLLSGDDGFGPAAAPLALIVAPTRELALQVKRELGWLYGKTGARLASCVGGMDMRDERRALERGAHIVVGTPGRLRDHIQRGSLDMDALRAVVLDEADEMLDLGFREDLEFMLGEAPEDRRTLMFSATVPPMIAKLAGEFQRDAKRVNTVGDAKQHTDIAYQALRVADRDSENAIFNLLRFHDAENAIVFANTRAAVAHLTARLSNRGLAVVSLSGELSQNERTHALQAMRDGRAHVCVATDVAARGIDLPNLDLVIHADLPSNTEGLLHRSGRTGRAGRKGISALIVPPKATKKAERLLKWAKITAEWTTPPSADDIAVRDEERLLADPAWTEEPTEAQRSFATKLLERYDAETIAAAYLRLYQSGQGAPEDLLPPDTRPERKERAPFGPSRWIALSVGRGDNAEARWLLPLLCRAGNLDKSAIGAIRVQDSETFVELTEASLDGFLGNLGADGELDEGVKARVLDAAPDLAPQPRQDRGPRRDGPSGKPHRKGGNPREDRGERKPRDHGGAKKKFDDKRRTQEAEGVTAPYKPKGKPGGKDAKPKWDKPKGNGPKGGKPKGAAAKPASKPAPKPAPKPKGKPGALDTSKSFRKPGGAKGPKGAKGKPPRQGGFDKPKRKG
ncbi:DEAD/DEAH box helicase [Maritimibacter dapengensis]|uniref:DEAD/DEAH box helicase n=1 Tax=Maritimibacter dapengensis TaxID=2836868 RepID=A0ABS6T3P7_9RHOB|nr:DEAD/DEAH box helicase [Maritimibacter dapengensis]MBV7379853.1 DEAD/DEAH box helicase [Maritimibacter dapengensis]